MCIFINGRLYYFPDRNDLPSSTLFPKYAASQPTKPLKTKHKRPSTQEAKHHPHIEKSNIYTASDSESHV